VTLSATVTDTQTAATPAGTVGFFDGATEVGAAPVGAGGVATLTLSSLGVGKHSFTAAFLDPAANFAPSGSAAAAALTVTKAGTTTALTATTAAPAFGQAVTFTATVAPAAPSAATPTGSVTFKDGGTVLATVSLSGGAASWTTRKLAVGGHALTATYNGSGTFTASGPASAAVTVSRGAVTVAVTPSVSSPVYGQAVTLTARVTASPGAGTPTGTVSFYDGTALLGSPALVNGVAVLKTAALSAGGHTLTAVYNGDGNFVGPTPAVLPITVRPDTVRTTLTTSSATASHTKPVTLSAAVLAVSPGAGVPTGAVQFWDGATLLGTAPLGGGVAQLVVTFAVVGKHKITAVYGGDSNFAPGSAVLTETIT
jgi:hypothetical protein